MSVFSFYLLSLWNIYVIFANKWLQLTPWLTHQNHLQKSFDGRVFPFVNDVGFDSSLPRKPALTFLFCLLRLGCSCCAPASPPPLLSSPPALLCCEIR